MRLTLSARGLLSRFAVRHSSMEGDSTGLSEPTSLGLVRLVVALSVIAAVLIGVVGLANSLIFFDKRADGYSGLGYLDLVYGQGYRVPGNEPRSLFTDRQVVEVASVLMSQNSEYRVVVGPAWRPGWTTPWSSTLEADFLRYYLMPRRQVPAAPWVFCFACDHRAIKGLEILVGGRAGLSFGRVRG
jgi:hypothetical protein